MGNQNIDDVIAMAGKIGDKDAEAFMESLEENPSFAITVDKDRMKARLMLLVDPDRTDYTPSMEDIERRLQSMGVVYNIQTDDIEKLLADKEVFTEIVAAKGVKAVNGINSRIDYPIVLREHSPMEYRKIKSKDDKQKMMSGTPVKKGQTLAMKTPATNGLEGSNVYGHPLAAYPGVEFPLPAGENTSVPPDGASLVSTVDGVAVIVEGKVCVMETKPAQKAGGDKAAQGHEQDAPVILTVSDNRMKASAMTLINPDQPGAVPSLDEVLAYLNKRGVVFNINKEAIDRMLREKKNVDVVVAEGSQPVDGKDAVVETAMTLRTCTKNEFKKLKETGGKKKIAAGTWVNKGVALITKSLATKGIHGTNVLGKSVPARDGKDCALHIGENMEMSADGLSLVSTVEGIAMMVDGVASVIEIQKEKVEFVVSPDEMKATLVLTPGDSEKIEADPEKIKKMVEAAGITHGIDEDYFKRIPKTIKAPVEIVVAEGRTPVHGVDGRVKIVWEEERKKDGTPFKVGDDGRVNFKERTDTGIVKPGDVVAVVLEPTSGYDGMTIRGKVIPTIPGRPLSLTGGKNVELDETQEKIIATKGGKLVVVGNTVRVDDFMKIENNVDYNTGNITFDGSVCVMGDLLTDFYISASGDVEIYGAVDGGSVVSGSNIIIHGTIFGADKSRIKAAGDVRVMSANQAHITAGNDLIVEHYLRGCDVLVSGDLTITHKKKGHIIGGKLSVGGNIETFELGNMTYTTTVVMMGGNPETQAKYDECLTEIINTKHQIRKIEPNLRTLNAQRGKGDISPDKDSLFRKLLTARMALQKKMATLEAQRDDIEDKMKRVRRGKLVVTGKAYPGVMIRIGIANYLVRQEFSRVIFSCLAEDVVTSNF